MAVAQEGADNALVGEPLPCPLWHAAEEPAMGEVEDSGRKPTKRRRMWRQMLDHGLQSFINKQPKTFQQRVQRGIPAECRWDVWKATMGVDEHIQPGLYEELVAAESEWTGQLEIDVPRTFSEVSRFDTEDREMLLRILRAYANLNPAIGYCQGMNYIVALLVLVSQTHDFGKTSKFQREQEVFWMFVCLMEDGRLEGLFRRGFPLLQRLIWAYDQILGESLPDLQAHFAREGVQPEEYLYQWYLTLFVNSLPLPMVLVIWDSIVCCGIESVLTITVALLGTVRNVLLTMSFEEIFKFFKVMKVMRTADSSNDAAAAGRLVVLHGGRISVPADVARKLSDPLPCTDSARSAYSPASSPKEQEHAISKPLLGDEPGRSDDDAADNSSLLGGYWGQLSELPLGMFGWWQPTALSGPSPVDALNM